MTKNLITKTIVFFIFVIIETTCLAQSINNDLELALSQKFNKLEITNKPKFLFIPDKKIIRYNPISLTFGGLMFLYQSVISPQISAGCPYEISCSNYSKAVISRYGFIKGIALTSYRLMRCNRIAAIDIHPLYINSAGKIIDEPEQYHLK